MGERMSGAAAVGTSAGTGRRYVAAVIDGLLALGCGLAMATGYVLTRDSMPGGPGPNAPGLGISFAAGLFGWSFLNHVPLTVTTRASAGKALAGIRVVRAADGGRPRPHQALLRWLGGLAWGLVVLPAAYVLGGSDADPQDFAGLRLTRPE
ncbi:RDD family protein [Streptomyces sp. NPDC055897]